MKLPLRFDSDYHGDLLHWRASLSFITPPVSKADAHHHRMTSELEVPTAKVVLHCITSVHQYITAVAA